MNGVLKAAWALTGFVVLLGLVLWIATGRAVFAVFILLGVLTAAGAWFSARPQATPSSTPSSEEQQ